MHVWRLIAVVALTGAAIPVTVEADTCNPYPVGRCGDHDRELVTFCYRTVAGRMIDASDPHVIALATSEGVALPDNNAKGMLYLRLSPGEAFLEDPYESDLPYRSLIAEENNVRGVQLAPFKCGHFIWFAECDSWMGPYNIQPPGNALYGSDRALL